MRLRRRGTNETRSLLAGMVFGRLATNDWHVDDPSVSRRHARVVVEASVWYLEDLGSSNGTHLNGVRVPRLALRAGDLVTLGSVAFDVLESEEAELRPAPAPAAASAPAAAAASAASPDRERARLHADLRRTERSRGFGDLSQQSSGMKFLAFLIGLMVLAGVTWGVRIVAGLF